MEPRNIGCVNMCHGICAKLFSGNVVSLRVTSLVFVRV